MDYQELFATFEQAADAEQAAPMSAYMRDQFPYLGVKTPQRKVLSRDFLKAAKRTGVVDWGFIDTCWERDEREFQYLALDYLAALVKALTPQDIPCIKRLAQTKSWWDTVDNLDTVIGQIALSYPEVNKTLLAWSTDDDFWLRRLAIDHQLLRKERTDTELLRRILVNNLGQTEFFINKAIGWALRDYSKTDPAWVRAFIEEHRAQMAPLSIREASKYL
ncbi:MAG: DNA alkylation repair protein [Actinomycetia bacterium]|nr:DNA alkylation repair protein [Actinomycetes bacterium]